MVLFWQLILVRYPHLTVMKIEELTYQNGDTEDLIVRLRGKVFHLTTQTAFDFILKSNAILHNKDELFRLNTNSENSFGRRMGCVCLVDIRNQNPEHLNHVLNCYDFLGPSWFADLQEDCTVWKLAYLILAPAHYHHLIPYEKVHEHYRATGKFPQVIPKGETWIKDRIPLPWMETVLLATIRNAAPWPK